MERRSRLRGILVDVAPLRRDHDFRWLFAGQTVNGTGNQITRVALPFQVYLLTGSTLALGLLAFLQLVPILVFSLGAGSIADAVDRRRLLALTQLGLMLCSASLFLLAIQPAEHRAHPCRRGPRGVDQLVRPARPLRDDPTAGAPGTAAQRHRARPAELPGAVDHRARHRWPDPGDAGHRGRVRHRRPLVHGVAARAHADPAAAPARDGRPAQHRGDPRGASLSHAGGG